MLGLDYFCSMYRIRHRAIWPSRPFYRPFRTQFLSGSLRFWRNGVLLFAVCMATVSACAQKGDRLQPKPALLRLIDANLRQSVNQYKILMSRVPAGRLPKTYYANTDKLETSDAGWWTSGFYCGTLFNLYSFSHDTTLLNEAVRRLDLLDSEQYNQTTHDLGFMMYCSFGNAQRFLDNPQYKNILLNSAHSLSTRFNPKIGCIKSWDSKPWHFPVIIDNMMNLELLFWATRVGGDSSFYHIAVTHANTTLRNHYRPDYSSYHVVDYDTATGDIIAKKTAQGYADSSAWARGQSWGLYGYTMVYRSTHDPRYLEQARHIAHFILANPNLPADKIPYWDYNAPGIPPAGATGAATSTAAGSTKAGISAGSPAGSRNMMMTGPLRDASAAAILASALIELSHYVAPKEGRDYLNVAEQIIVTLSSNVYKPVVGSNGGFILRHSVGNLPGHSEIDVPLTYADYYFVEAMLRYIELGQK
jgi:unsaturated chondroitin disaccharide hydrolase